MIFLNQHGSNIWCIHWSCFYCTKSSLTTFGFTWSIRLEIYHSSTNYRVNYNQEKARREREELDKMLEENRRRVEEAQRREALELQRKEEERHRELELIQRQKEEAARRKKLEDEEELIKLSNKLNSR